MHNGSHIIDVPESCQLLRYFTCHWSKKIFRYMGL